jgi:hypothetical protein
MSRVCAAVLALLLGACSSAGDWAKPGADRQATELAYSQCRAVGARAVGTDIAIDKDILATRGNDWQRADMLPVVTGEMRQNARVRGDTAIASCMAAKGFTRPSARPPLPQPRWRLP